MIHTMTVNGNPCEYVDYGGDGKAPMVLLHGWAQDHRLFRYVAPLLAEHFHVIALNFRGHDGHLSDVGDFTAEDLVSDVIAFCRKLKLADVRFVSTSHGGWVNIAVQDELGSAALGRTVVIDWLMEPSTGFLKQLADGQAPETAAAARQALFNMWIAGTDVLDVIDHVNREMTWFGMAMWQRAFREIERSYERWGRPLERMSAVEQGIEVTHIYSQPLGEEYLSLQADYAAAHSWYTPLHIPGQTHFPTLENPEAVVNAILAFYA